VGIAYFHTFYILVYCIVVYRSCCGQLSNYMFNLLYIYFVVNFIANSHSKCGYYYITDVSDFLGVLYPIKSVMSYIYDYQLLYLINMQPFKMAPV